MRYSARQKPVREIQRLGRDCGGNYIIWLCSLRYQTLNAFHAARKHLRRADLGAEWLKSLTFLNLVAKPFVCSSAVSYPTCWSRIRIGADGLSWLIAKRPD